MEASLLLPSSDVIKDHVPCGEFTLVVYVAVVLTACFHLLQPLLEDLHVLWQNAKVQQALVKHPGPYGAVWQEDNLEAD